MSHMLDEIREQPDVVRNIIDREFHQVEALAAEIKRRNVAFAYIAARGTSDNAAVYCKYVLEIQHGLPTAIAAPSVVTVYDTVPKLGPQAFVLGISQSGAAPDVIEVLKCARQSGALTACITNEPTSALAEASEHVLTIGAGEEKGIAATKTYTGSLALIALLSTALDETHPERLVYLQRAADAMEKSLGMDEALHQLVEKYKAMTGCVIIGRGYNHCTAAETALKITETSYISAKSYSAAAFQHGPIAQVNSGFPCLLFAPDGKAFSAMAELGEKLRQQHPALISFAHDAAFLASSETAVRIPASVAEWVSPMVYAVAGQLFAYWLSLAKGLDPDAPRGLEKVTKTV
ncbi:glucosamine--fructose-6-phosphate aminotransferase [Capsulimonas corticalis]|uniref:Glucosamine--fructose-6-phosphate aminotransferase n=1 Tax=Capsulimonas corticalis TaxID=2219043 RepID=A0A402CUC6_9BACT|nr:SIS domain-containing protein [Capsulimonas corticalis]BDI28953.1 glucosamine--fructose-6-phosphate aminotransferase [Capsulimonas corticalis]